MTAALLTRTGIGWVPRAVPHRSSHRPLLHPVPHATGSATVDAVIVPAARDLDHLESAFQLAAALKCQLLVLCSQDAKASAVRDVAFGVDADIIAVDVEGVPALPSMRTTRVLAGTSFARSTDTPLKRNLGLAVTRMTGWRNVLFLDDDISGLEAAVVARAATVLDRFPVVGLDNVGYADNSVVCHANRDTGGVQGTFVGAGAMLFRSEMATSLFPDVYNEDWFFLINNLRLVDIGVHGTFAQAQFDPYSNRMRAGGEEFGDFLAEGIFALFDEGLTVREANLLFWKRFLPVRAELIETILRRLPGAPMSVFRRNQVQAALWAARTSLDQISPGLCVEFLAAWRADRARWRIWAERLPTGLPTEMALAELGFTY
jgi:hypothetical protein